MSLRSWLKAHGIYTETVFARDDPKNLYRWQLRIGRLAIHKFYRGDSDPDGHDHPAYFYTFPLHNYVEEIYDPLDDSWFPNLVGRYWIHYRPATYCHRLVGRFPIEDIKKPFWTIVWWGPREREWGFYKNGIWIQWRKYLNKGDDKLWID